MAAYLHATNPDIVRAARQRPSVLHPPGTDPRVLQLQLQIQGGLQRRAGLPDLPAPTLPRPIRPKPRTELISQLREHREHDNRVPGGAVAVQAPVPLVVLQDVGECEAGVPGLPRQTAAPAIMI